MPDQLLPQPPPDAPAPPAGEVALRSRRKMWWMIGIGVCSAIALPMIHLTVGPMLVRARLRSSHEETVKNAKQIRLALIKFETQYGRFPDVSTAAAVRLKTGSSLTFRNGTSNDLFAQLLAAKSTPRELIFHADVKSARVPDDVFNTDKTILERGECVFAYVPGLSSTSDYNTPVLFGPVIPGTATFDRGYKSEAIIVKADGSVTPWPINSAGKLMKLNGIDLLDPRQPYWHGKAPDVKWPK